MAGFGSIFKEQLSHGSALAVCGTTKPCYYIEIVLTFIYVALGIFFQKPSNSYYPLMPFSVCVLTTVCLLPFRASTLLLLGFSTAALDQKRPWVFRIQSVGPWEIC